MQTDYENKQVSYRKQIEHNYLMESKYSVRPSNDSSDTKNGKKSHNLELSMTLSSVYCHSSPSPHWFDIITVKENRD